LSSTPLQVCDAQTVWLSGKVQAFWFAFSHVPTHFPVPLQALRGVDEKLHVPVAQDSQFPSHRPSQQ
jgi:hypothetical protein